MPRWLAGWFTSTRAGSAAPAPGTYAARTTYGKAYAFAIPRASNNGDGALRVALMLSERDSVPLFARALGMAPAHRGALAPLAGDLFEPVYYPEALVARGWLSPAPSDTDRIFATMVNNVLSGRESVGNALDTASQSLSAALK